VLAIGAVSRSLNDFVRALSSDPHHLVRHISDLLDRRALLREVIRLVPFGPQALVSLPALQTPGLVSVSVTHSHTPPSNKGTPGGALALVASNPPERAPAALGTA
jgi:hypothetical protein